MPDAKAIPLVVLQVTPSLDVGGSERTTLDVARAVTVAGGKALIATAPLTKAALPALSSVSASLAEISDLGASCPAVEGAAFFSSVFFSQAVIPSAARYGFASSDFCSMNLSSLRCRTRHSTQPAIPAHFWNGL